MSAYVLPSKDRLAGLIFIRRDILMEGDSNTNRYSPSAQMFHWLTVILVIGAWTLGIVGDDLPRGWIRHSGEVIHIFFGETVLVMLFLRLAVRFLTPRLVKEPQINPMVTYAASVVHLSLYVLLFVVPAAGILTLFYGGEPLTIFGIFDIASPWSKNRALTHDTKEIHEFSANLLLAMAGVHAIAALVHHYVLKDRALRRMLPAAWTNE